MLTLDELIHSRLLLRYTCSLTHSAACVVTQCSSRQLYRQHNILCSAIVYSMNTLRDDEEFTIISDEEDVGLEDLELDEGADDRQPRCSDINFDQFSLC